MWIIKCILAFTIFCICLFIPIGFFKVVIEIAKFLAIILSVMIIINLIDLFYTWAERWIKLFDEGAQIMGALIILFTLFFYGLTIYLTIMNWSWFTGGDECGYNKVAIGITVVCYILCTGLTIAKIYAEASIMTSGLICFYIWLLSW